MSKPWFHAETGYLLLDEHLAERPAFQKVMSDAIVRHHDLAAQANCVTDLLRRIEL
jgi:hypothetical protein